MDVEGEKRPLCGGPHPLLIHLVVENVALQLLREGEDETLLQSRLVCQVWDEVITKVLRSTSNRTVRFGNYFGLPGELLEFCHYLDSSSSLAHFPIGRFHLGEDVFQRRDLYTVETFFRECATLLTSLSIRLDNQSDLEVSEMELGDVGLPNLKRLVFDDRRTSSLTAHPHSFLEGLLAISPRLKELTVVHPPPSKFDGGGTAPWVYNKSAELNLARMLRERCPKHLRHFTLDIKLTDKVLLTLSELPARLLELKLSLNESKFSKESLHKVLESQKESLQSLRLCSMGTKSHFEITFPTLSSLTLLELHGWDTPVDGVTLSEFSYKDHFPSLRNLLLHTWAENPSWAQLFPAAYYGTVSSLTHLKLPQNYMNPAMIQNLSWLYPNLSRLDVHLSKGTLIMLQRVFAHFSESLEQLKIRDCSSPREKWDFCLDSLFTGLPALVCEVILRRRMFDPRIPFNHPLRLRDAPALLNLKNLKELDLVDVLRRHEFYVTDVSGYLVLLQMPSLQCLRMGRSQMNDECLGHLAKMYSGTMHGELSVQKPAPPRMPPQKKRKSLQFLHRGTVSGVVGAYNFCLSTMDTATASTCAIL